MVTADISKMKVVHVMKDGEIRDSIKGLVPPAETGCYDVLNAVRKRLLKEKEKEKS